MHESFIALSSPIGPPQVTAYKAAHEKDEKDPKKLKTEGMGKLWPIILWMVAAIIHLGALHHACSLRLCCHFVGCISDFVGWYLSSFMSLGSIICQSPFLLIKPNILWRSPIWTVPHFFQPQTFPSDPMARCRRAQAIGSALVPWRVGWHQMSCWVVFSIKNLGQIWKHHLESDETVTGCAGENGLVLKDCNWME